jgi:hypothetical protein
MCLNHLEAFTNSAGTLSKATNTARSSLEAWYLQSHQALKNINSRFPSHSKQHQPKNGKTKPNPQHLPGDVAAGEEVLVELLQALRSGQALERDTHCVMSSEEIEGCGDGDDDDGVCAAREWRRAACFREKYFPSRVLPSHHTGTRYRPPRAYFRSIHRIKYETVFTTTIRSSPGEDNRESGHVGPWNEGALKGHPRMYPKASQNPKQTVSRKDKHLNLSKSRLAVD